MCRYNVGYLHLGTCGELMASGLCRYMRGISEKGM